MRGRLEMSAGWALQPLGDTGAAGAMGAAGDVGTVVAFHLNNGSKTSEGFLAERRPDQMSVST